MRRNFVNLSRICSRSLSCNIEIENHSVLKRLNQYRAATDSQQNYVCGIPFTTIRCYTDTRATTCWNCHRPTDIIPVGTKESFFCSSCGSLQEMNKTYNYFSLFGIDEQFLVDQSELTKKFRDFQSVLHPDKFSNKNEIEQNLSATISSLVNKAYKTLLTPIKRAEYILGLKGITIPEDNNAVDKEFLFEIMERNEEVEDANDADDLNKLLVRVQDDKEKYFAEFDVNFRNGDLLVAKATLILLRYYGSLETSIKNKLSKLN
ncbi:iron-sulfur cluster co-chaperone protein HscB isoform X1 [Bradysia coprophila]|uniref:iron-sulfur cluster co-chaperone protein HscB isoform X1 n=1 Tax=Bradysia coprophila TaxID=38358 RepID=UPI00187DAF80|nr:iron-sulfur cluster co-chaperone protein HscB isoform X1 [Bradysia coprophila]